MKGGSIVAHVLLTDKQYSALNIIMTVFPSMKTVIQYYVFY